MKGYNNTNHTQKVLLYIREHYEERFANKTDNLGEIDMFLERQTTQTDSRSRKSE